MVVCGVPHIAKHLLALAVLHSVPDCLRPDHCKGDGTDWHMVAGKKKDGGKQGNVL